MYPEQLGKNEIYYHPKEFIFQNPNEFIRCFVMRDYSIGMHEQGFLEINIILSGEGMHYFDKRKLPAKTGDIFIIPAEVSHGYVGGEGFDVYHFLIHDRFMEKYRADFHGLPCFYTLFKVEPLMRGSDSVPLHLTLTKIQLEKISRLLTELEEYSLPKNYPDALMCNSLAMMLIARLCVFYKENTRDMDEKELQYDEAFMNALTLIHEHYDEKISISRLAKIAHLSRSGFIQRFCEVCKMPPAKYLINRRIEAAEHLLANTNLSISDVAESTGFYDTSHLTRMFTSEIGCSPAVYRKKLQI